MAILSIQSHVAYGRVGNRLAVFALERLGHEVWPINTVDLSNHPAYGAYRGRVVPAGEVAALIAGIAERGAFSRCEAVLSGYLGAPETGPVVLDAVAQAKAANPQAVYCLDPVMGDRQSGIYVAEGLLEFFRGQALPLADIVIGNDFEIGLLAGHAARSFSNPRDAATALLAKGPAVVVATGIAEGATLATMALSHEGAWIVRSPRVAAPSYGAGDLFNAVFLDRLLATADVAAALEHTVSAVYGVFAVTAQVGGDALALAAAQDELIAPSRLFTAAVL
ncbi:MAG TPA: pyridoxal kinase PdxY [Alphaproteobacteria bacterium]|nr:pyridoxal kinase PdxY [Alphaproteobacteria bacterium]